MIMKMKKRSRGDSMVEVEKTVKMIAAIEQFKDGNVSKKEFEEQMEKIYTEIVDSKGGTTMEEESMKERYEQFAEELSKLRISYAAKERIFYLVNKYLVRGNIWCEVYKQKE